AIVVNPLFAIVSKYYIENYCKSIILFETIVRQAPRAFYACNACLTAGKARLQAFRGKDLRTNT
ncbi:MAG: hypothetical protein LBO77_08705, partial [Desulfovibrio sp.]|nr:hypothetical protein [Desulfovibrio sp.]